MDFLINGGTIIQQVCEAGAEISLVGDKIKVEPVSILPSELLDDLRHHRQDVIQALPLYPVILIQKTNMRAINKHGCFLEEKAIIKLISPLDWPDVSARYDFELQYWANELAPEAICNSGMVPHDWNKVAKCNSCGWVFYSKSGNCIACPWCEVRAAGVWFPTPGLNRCANPRMIDGVMVQECEIKSNNIDVVISECFFCGERHVHGSGAKEGKDWRPHAIVNNGIAHLGHRHVHCIRKDIVIPLSEGHLVSSKNGYYLGIGDQQNL